MISPELIAACESIPGWSWSKHTFLPFAEARTFVRALGLRNQKEWYAYVRSKTKPSNIPAGPVSAYKGNGWISWCDWLGTENIHSKTFRPFDDARAFIQSLGLLNMEGWKAYCNSGKRPSNIPSNPNVTYKGKGWAGYGDWLGTGNTVRSGGAIRWRKAKATGA
jgi:hypothetical protein